VRASRLRCGPRPGRPRDTLRAEPRQGTGGIESPLRSCGAAAFTPVE
jgi:hypothetical protein